MPCVVPFPDQAPSPVGMGDNGLVLAKHLQFPLSMQDQPAPEHQRHLSSISVQLRLKEAFSSVQSSTNQ